MPGNYRLGASGALQTPWKLRDSITRVAVERLPKGKKRRQWDIRTVPPSAPLMLRKLLRSKIHRARVTQADLNYEGSITIDTDLMNEAKMMPFEVVDVLNVSNGNRLTTYVIPGVAGSKKICINGAAARLVKVDDVVIICCYGQFNEEEVEKHSAQIVLVNEKNEIVRSVEKSKDNLKPG